MNHILQTEMSLQDLPLEILIEIIARYLPQLINDVQDYSRLRLVSRTFNQVFLYALIELDVGWTCFRHVVHPLVSHHDSLVIRFWRACLSRPPDRSLPLESEETSICLGSRFSTLVNRRVASNYLSTLATTHQCDDKCHAAHIRTAILDAASQYAPKVGVAISDDLIGVPPQSTNNSSQLSTLDECIRIFCRASIIIYGRALAWQLLFSQKEILCDYRTTRWTFYHPSHHVENWILRAAAYTNDIKTVEAILESMHLHIKDQVIWRERISEDYSPLVRRRRDPSPRLARSPSEPGHYFSVEEQRWITAISAAFKIAASLGHIRLLLRLVRIEPDFMRQAFITCFGTSSNMDPIAAAISHDQKEAFQLLSRFTRPLVTKNGFARRAYFIAIASAFKQAYHGLDSYTILENLLDICDAWKYPDITARMLHPLAAANNIRLAKILLDRLAGKRPHMFAYLSLKQDILYLFPGTQPHNFVIATAAYCGHVEFVRFLLSHPSASDESKNEALECAIHTLTCHVKSMSDNHIVILEDLLSFQNGLFLEDAFLKAVCSRSNTALLMDIMLRHIDLSAKTTSFWSESKPRRCRTLQEMATASIMDPKERSNVGEIALAIALTNQRLEIARTLVENHDVVLGRYFVVSVINIEEVDLDELAELNGKMAAMGMEVESMALENDYNFLEFIFRPKSRFKVEPVEFNIGAPIYCKI